MHRPSWPLCSCQGSLLVEKIKNKQLNGEGLNKEKLFSLTTKTLILPVHVSLEDIKSIASIVKDVRGADDDLLFV